MTDPFVFVEFYISKIIKKDVIANICLQWHPKVLTMFYKSAIYRASLALYYLLITSLWTVVSSLIVVRTK